MASDLRFALLTARTAPLPSARYGCGSPCPVVAQDIESNTASITKGVGTGAKTADDFAVKGPRGTGTTYFGAGCRLLSCAPAPRATPLISAFVPPLGRTPIHRRRAVKSPSDFVGLANEGCTCYLNSLLQVCPPACCDFSSRCWMCSAYLSPRRPPQGMYSLPELRRALYGHKFDPEAGEPNTTRNYSPSLLILQGTTLLPL